MESPVLPATSRMGRVLLSLLVLAVFACGTGVAGEAAAPVRLDFKLSDMPKKGEQMTVHCYLDAQHRITNGWASPGSPTAMHHIFTDKLVFRDERLQGTFRLYRSNNVAVEVDGRLKDGILLGTYKGTWGEDKGAAETKGTLQGRILTDADLNAVHKIKTPQAWPQWRGPDNGKGTVCPTDKPLIDDPAKARIAWISEAVFPDTPTDSAACTSRWDFASGWGTPVVADGRVYCAYYKGDTDEAIDHAYYEKHVGRQGEFTARNRASIYSEDVLVCVDIETGKTLWKNVYDRAGYFQYDYQFGWMQPVVKDGKVYVMGQMGYVYCVDAKTGETQWITDTGGAIRDWQLVLRQNVRQGAQHRKQRDHLSQPLVVVDGVVGAVQGGLLGIDAKTGQKRWASGSSIVPLIWKHKGRSYILRDNECIEPATGKVVWSGPRGYSICSSKSIGTLGEDHVVRDRDGGGGGLTCYKLSLEGPELVWELPPKVITRHPSSNMAIYNGHVYALARSSNRQRTPNRWLCIRLADGKVVGEVPWKHDPRAFAGGQLATDNRIIWWRPASKEVYMLAADPNNFRRLADETKWDGPYRTHVGSAVITDGRLITRGVSELYCYDFRDTKPEQLPAPAALPSPPVDIQARLEWPYHETRSAAGKSGDPEALLAALQSGEWLKMAAAGRGLRELGAKAAPLASELRKLLLKAVDEKRYAAVDLLSKLLASVDKAGAGKTVEALQAKLTTDQAEQAAHALVAFAEKAPQETASAKTQLIDLLDSKNAKAAIAAANCLRQIPLGKEAVAPLKRAVLEVDHQPAEPLLKGYCRDALIEIVRNQQGSGAAEASAALVEIHRADEHFASDVCKLLTIEFRTVKNQAAAKRYADIALKIAGGVKNVTRAFQDMLPLVAEHHENKQEVARVMEAIAKEHGDSRTGRNAEAALKKLKSASK